MQAITRENLQHMMDRGDDFALVEVLPVRAFKDYHLPGAINIPISAPDFEQRVRKHLPDRKRAVVVYCQDRNCTGSAKAAAKLEAMGYQVVYDYEGGKEDWKLAGLPVEASG